MNVSIKFFMYLVGGLIFLSCDKSPLFMSNGDKGEERVISELNASTGFSWDKNIQFGYKWIDNPIVGQKSSFVLKFWDKNLGHFLGPYLFLDQPLCIFIWMKMHDGGEHGSSPVQIQKLDDHYLIDEIYFIMPGTWKVFIRTVNDTNDCRDNPNDLYLKEFQFEVTPH